MSSAALAAVDPLLGYLSSAIRDEAQLLGGVRRDAQFIMDEMQSMDGFLRHLDEAGVEQRNHQVRVWMKQVQDLADDTQDCLDLYRRRVGQAPLAQGACGHVRHALFFLQTISARHQVGNQIRELKSRAREVSDRRLRYGVKVPANETAGESATREEALDLDARKRGLFDITSNILEDGTKELVSWLKKAVVRRAGDIEAQATEGVRDGRQPIVIAVEAPDTADGGHLAKQVYQHPSVASLFDCKAWVTIQRPPFLGQILHEMIQQLPPAPDPAPAPAHQGQGGGAAASDDVEDKTELQKRLKGRRFLVVVEEAEHPYPWYEMKKILDSSGCSSGSAIMLTTMDSELAKQCSPDKTIVHSLVHFCFKKADQLIPTEYEDDGRRVIMRRILKTCDPDLFCMKLLLGALHDDPSTSIQQLQNLLTSLYSAGRRHDGRTTTKKPIRTKMMKFCYEKLPKTAKSCLLYLSIFNPGFRIRKASLTRRWIAEGQVTERDGQEALDRVEYCFEYLAALGFVNIAEVGNLGNVITYMVPDFVRDFISEIRYERSGDLHPNLACHISIRSNIQWHHVLQRNQQDSGSICNCFPWVEPQGAPDDITTFLDSLPSLPRVARVKVMDLDYCKHLKKRHLKNICNNLFMLKYLSILKTEISQLPREMKKLQQLETLDIRGTKVPSSATRGLLLPMLKHLLAGPVDYRVGVWPEEELSTVQMPHKIGMMTSMETLVHVEVAEDDKELQHIKYLKRLTNLGVVIHGKQDNVDHLLGVVTELDECLLKLSVWVKSPCNGVPLNMKLDNTEQRRPKKLVRLDINGITTGLPDWIEDLPRLAEISLRKTSLSDASLPQLGKLRSLRSLILRHGSYTGSILTFETNQFQKMEYLVIEDACEIEKINFETDTAPRLTKIVWKSTRGGTIVGLNKLASLKELELNVNGDFDLSQVLQDVAHHPNCPNIKYMITGNTIP